MNIFGFNISRLKKTIQAPTSPQQRGIYYGRTPAKTDYFDGEKTPGSLGFLKNSIPDYHALRHRAFEADLKKDVVKIITGKFFKWVVGKGLKLQSEPSLKVLETEGINMSKEQRKSFVQSVEARFSVYCKSKLSDYTRNDNMHVQAQEAFKTAFLGGDVLCILRVEPDYSINVQTIDGQHVASPPITSNEHRAAKKRGNRILHGVEVNKRNQHVAFFVKEYTEKNPLGKYKRILAVGRKSKNTLAFLIYGNKHRVDHVRGIPVITQILEKIEKLDRYTEAVVGSAEERAKIVLAIEHNAESDGSNPFLEKVRLSAGMGQNADAATKGYESGEITASQIAATTGKQTFNLPIGAKLNAALNSQQEMEYGPFSKAVFIFLCAGVDIPPEVALQMYEQNYSSSRAAIKGWEYIVNIYREKFAQKFYMNFYKLWLETEVLKNKIKAPQFLKAIVTENQMAVDAYCSARFVGERMPHIDPVKEVNAVRAILGNKEDALCSREQAAEMLSLGDWEQNNEKFNEESKKVETKKEEQNDSSSQNNKQQQSLER